MILFRASAIVLMQLGIIPVAYSQRELNGTASPGNTIHIEEDLDLSYDRDTIVITSDVPVTIQRYNDAGAGKFYVDGQQPVTADMGKVLITSNCDTSQTEIDPAVAISSNGDITITLPGVSNEEAADMPFLDPSSYSAMWTWVSGWCSFDQQTAYPVFANDGVDGTTKCETSSAANPFDGCATEGEFCQLKMEVCGDNSKSYNGVCQATPEVCTEEYDPVCGCDGADYSNACNAHSSGVSVSSMGKCGSNESLPTTGTMPEAMTTMASVSANIEATTTSVATADAITTESTATAATKFAAIDGDFPTKAPSTSKPATVSPTYSLDADGATEPNSAFNRSFSFCVATTLLVIVAISVIFPGNDGGNHFWGFGKLAVAAVAVSSVYPKSSIQKSSQGQKSPLHSQTKRALQTCSFNVEVLIDSCTKSVEINAPAGRVIELSSIDNQMAQQRPDDECTTDYNATLDFSVTDDTVVLDLEENNTYAAYDQWSFQCARAVAGRPFVDDKGGSLQATPCVPSDEFKTTALSWTGEALMEIQASHVGNATDRDRFLMGEDWTQRALGEHASVASFSAFSIALMTNHAPSDLVNDALMAGMDEVRHAKVSFDIASRLTGKDVGPGPLPPSSHEFGQDLGALALAVAREGCVDETLSTFAAAMEVEHINQVLEKGMQDDLYANIGRDMLTLIRDELVTIAMDESNHSALAWRTLGWVCGADLNACDSVYTDVFEESNLGMRFKQRAHALFGEKSTVLSSMRGEWMKIFNAHQLAHSGLSVCKKSNTAGIWEDESGQGLLTSVTENVVRQVLCR